MRGREIPLSQRRRTSRGLDVVHVSALIVRCVRGVYAIHITCRDRPGPAGQTSSFSEVCSKPEMMSVHTRTKNLRLLRAPLRSKSKIISMKCALNTEASILLHLQATCFSRDEHFGARPHFAPLFWYITTYDIEYISRDAAQCFVRCQVSHALLDERLSRQPSERNPPLRGIVREAAVSCAYASSSYRALSASSSSWYSLVSSAGMPCHLWPNVLLIRVLASFDPDESTPFRSCMGREAGYQSSTKYFRT